MTGTPHTWQHGESWRLPAPIRAGRAIVHRKSQRGRQRPGGGSGRPGVARDAHWHARDKRHQRNRRRDRELPASDLPSGRRDQGRDQSGPGTVHRHHHRGRAASFTLPVSLAGTDDQLCEYISHRGGTIDRPAAAVLACVHAAEIEKGPALAGFSPARPVACRQFTGRHGKST